MSDLAIRGIVRWKQSGISSHLLLSDSQQNAHSESCLDLFWGGGGFRLTFSSRRAPELCPELWIPKPLRPLPNDEGGENGDEERRRTSAKRIEWGPINMQVVVLSFQRPNWTPYRLRWAEAKQTEGFLWDNFLVHLNFWLDCEIWSAMVKEANKHRIKELNHS